MYTSAIMPQLLIDTCTEQAQIAFFENETLLFKSFFAFGFQHSKELLPKLEEAFHFLNFKPKQLDAIFVTAGPGSYTGIRVGAIVGKTLSFTHHIPLVGLNTLCGFTPSKEGIFASVIDAKIGGAYVSLGKKTKALLCDFSEPKLLSLEQFKEQLQDIPTLVSPSFTHLKKRLDTFYPHLPWFWENKISDPVQLAQHGQRELKRGNFKTDGTLSLCYLRQTQAEIDKES